MQTSCKGTQTRRRDNNPMIRQASWHLRCLLIIIHLITSLLPPPLCYRYKFNIVNLIKDDSLYNNGMLPLVHSEREMAASSLGWHRAGEQVAYYR